MSRIQSWLRSVILEFIGIEITYTVLYANSSNQAKIQRDDGHLTLQLRLSVLVFDKEP